jgi:tRNA 5-methylaminomethyl-2-thiouridine biosynthesis bifunctional protein
MARADDPDLQWTEAGEPRSGRFGDVYFSAEDGLAESRAVFLAGCGLPEAWSGRERFTVAELGFGTGLNILALLELWRRTRPAGRLHVFSVEAFPLRAEDAARALARWPEIVDLATLLTARWPPRAPGFHRIDLPEMNAVIDLAVMPVEAALEAWSGPADAWFLDGFSPATNPGMWSEAVLRAVAARSAPGARAATFTVAGAVRRGLQAAGFQVEKRPGFGRKRERLEARFTGAPESRQAPRTAIIGGGVAGAALARAFRRLGASPVLIEAAAPGAGASGNPAALVTPRLDAGGGPVAGFHAQALERAAAIYRAEIPATVLAEGVLQLEQQPRDAGRFDRIAAQDLWPEDAVTRLDPVGASERLGEPSAVGGLWLRDALVVEPAPVLGAWLEGVARVSGTAAAVRRRGEAWAIEDPDGRTLAEAEAVCLAGGWGLHALRPDLPLAPVRGQATWTTGPRPACAVAWGGYAAPTRDGVLFGATHDRGETATDARPEDDARNLETLARALPGLAGALRNAPLAGRAAVRATTPDRLPLCGALEPGLFVLGGLGSRGFAVAPLLAEHLAALILGAPSPLPRAFAALVAPDRFRSRTADLR